MIICSQMKLWCSLLWNVITLHIRLDKCHLDILNMPYYFKVMTFKNWTKVSLPHNLLTSCWKSLMWIVELSDVFNRCQAMMNTAGSKVLTGLLPGVGGHRPSHGVQRVWQDTCRGADRASVMHNCVTCLTQQGWETKMMSSWVGHRWNNSRSGRPIVVHRFIGQDILYTWHLWQQWFIMFLHVLYLSLVLLAFEHTGYFASYMPCSSFRCVHKNH